MEERRGSGKGRRGGEGSEGEKKGKRWERKERRKGEREGGEMQEGAPSCWRVS